MNKELLRQVLDALEETTALCINYRSVEEDDGYRFTEADIVIPQGNAAIQALRTELAKPEPVPVATLHDDGYWTWMGVPPYESSFAGWRMDVYTKDQL